MAPSCRLFTIQAYGKQLIPYSRLLVFVCGGWVWVLNPTTP